MKYSTDNSPKQLNKIAKQHLKLQEINSLWNEYLLEFKEYKYQAVSAIKNNLKNNPAFYLGYGLARESTLTQAAYIFENNYSIFLEIKAFFLGKDKNIYCKRNIDFVFNMENYREVFYNFGYSCPSLKMIELLYRLLSLSREERIFWQYDMYKRANHVLNCIFDNPNFFGHYENNIYLDLDTGKEKILLHAKTYKKPVEFNNSQNGGYFHYGDIYAPLNKLQQPSIKQFRSIMSMIKPYIIEHKEEYVMASNSNQVLLQCMIRYLQQEKGMFESYPTSEWTMQNKENLGYILDFIRSQSDNDKLPMSFIQYLLMLTDGRLTDIDHLAKLIARTNLAKINNPKRTSTNNPIHPKMIITVTPNINLMQKLLSDIYLSEQKVVENTTLLCSDKCVIDSTAFKLNGGILHIIEKNSDVSEKDLKRLSKFIRSMPVYVKDYSVGRIKYISNSQYLMLVEKQEDLNTYKNYLLNLAEIISLQGNKVEEQIENIELVREMKRKKLPAYLNVKNFPQLEDGSVYWIKTVFSIYGFILLWEEHQTACKTREKLINNQDIVEQFISECCSQSEQADCYADELYDAYIQYFSYHYRVDPIKRIQLVNIVKLHSQYQYRRLRHSANDNKWGFKGLEVNKEKLQRYVLSESNSEQKLNKIKDYIRSINQKVIQIFSD